MNYYKDKQVTFREMEKIIKLTGKKGARVKALIYELTKKHPVSEMAINKRIKLLCDLGHVFKKKGRVFWKNG